MFAGLSVVLILGFSQGAAAFVSPSRLDRNTHHITTVPNQCIVSEAHDTFTKLTTTALHSSLFHETTALHNDDKPPPQLNKIKAAITKAGMISFVASMCVALPVTLLPPAILHKTKLISTATKERLSLRTGQFCSRWLMRIIPFANVQVVHNRDEEAEEAEPAVWVCNHTSMLDIFVLLATDKRMRGNNKRPIKIIYWKDLEKNPVTGLLFKMCGFLPVEMEDNGSGNTNQYKRASFKKLLKGIKTAFDEGFDIGILPEGQLNPHPEEGLLPVFSGAFTLARMSKRPIRMMGLHGLQNLWHGDDEIGMTVKGRQVKVRAYPMGRQFTSGDEFVESFQKIIGHWGAQGEDLPEWRDWMNGKAWERATAAKEGVEK